MFRASTFSREPRGGNRAVSKFWFLLVLLASVPVLFAESAKPTFSQDVWPIMKQSCVPCHQAGQIAPIAFTSYGQVRPWARAIRQAVLTRAMPPWHAEENKLHSFRNDRS